MLIYMYYISSEAMMCGDYGKEERDSLTEGILDIYGIYNAYTYSVGSSHSYLIKIK